MHTKKSLRNAQKNSAHQITNFLVVNEQIEKQGRARAERNKIVEWATAMEITFHFSIHITKCLCHVNFSMGFSPFENDIFHICSALRVIWYGFFGGHEYRKFQSERGEKIYRVKKNWVSTGDINSTNINAEREMNKIPKYEEKKKSCSFCHNERVKPSTE